MCLRALKALASYHYKETGAGKVGLGSQATIYKDADGKLQDGILSRFLRLLLQLLLFEDVRCSAGICWIYVKLRHTALNNQILTS